MLEELARRGEERGCVVLTGRGAELERDLPFGVWVDALDDHVAWLGPDRLERMLGDRVAELARVLPSVERRDAAPAPALQDERYRAHRAVRALLEQLAAATPVVVLLDDLQWADDSSLELVAHLLRRPPRAPLLVACAFRAGGLAPAVLGAFEAAGRDGRVVDVRLAPLTRRRGRRAARRRRCPRACARSCSGSAAATRSTSQQLARGGRSTRDGRGARARPSCRPPSPSRSGRRSPRSASPARRLLQGAAVAGDPAELGLAAAAGEVGDGRAWPARSTSSSASRLLAPATLPRRYRFRHPIVRRAAYESAGEGWRLGGARAARRPRWSATGGPLAARAHHLERCAEPGDDGAIAVLAQAGHAAAPNAPAEAARWYTAALRLLPERRPAAAGGARAARHRARVDRASWSARSRRCSRCSRSCRRSWPSCAPGWSPRARRARTCSAATATRTSGSSRRSPSCPSATGTAAAMLEAELAADALYDSDFDALAERAAQARATRGRARRSRPARALRGARLLRATTAAGTPTRPRPRAPTPPPTLDAMDDGQLAGRLEASYYLGFAEFLCERYDDVIRHTERGLAVSRASGQGQFVVPMMVGLAHALETRGRLAEALDTVEGAVEAARLSGNRQVLSWALVGEGWVAAITGDLERAGRAAEEAVALLGELVGQHPHARDPRARRRSCSSRRATWSAASPRRRRAGAPEFAAIEPGRAAWLLRGAGARGAAPRRPEAAARRHRTARARCSTGMTLPLMESTVVQAEALLALDDGDAGAAPPGSPTEGAALADGVGAVVAGGADARARRPGARAAPATATRRSRCSSAPRPSWPAFGAERLRAEAARELRRLGVRVAGRQRRGAAGAGLAALSGREREIAELVALGRTNREIAAELFVSEKTVEGHLRNVFVKLGVSARAAVAEAVGRERAGVGD